MFLMFGALEYFVNIVNLFYSARLYDEAVLFIFRLGVLNVTCCNYTITFVLFILVIPEL